MARTPQLAMYRTSALTSYVIRHVLRPTTPYATLPNIVNARAASGGAGDEGLAAAPPLVGTVPELLLEACTPAAIASAALELLVSPHAAEAQIAASARALAPLAVRDRHGDAIPSATLAARALLKHLVPTTGDR